MINRFGAILREGRNDPRIKLGAGIASTTVAVSVVAWQVSPYLRLAPEALARAGLLRDDAFFYSALVENHAHYGFFTLDGEMPTNGFQPLWMLVLMAVHAITGVAALRLLPLATYFTYLALTGLASWFAYGSDLLRGLPRVALVAVLVLANARFQGSVVTGLETPLTLLVILVWAVAIDRSDAGPIETGTRRVARLGGLGALAGACFLARTDLLWVPLVTIGWWVWRHRRDWRGTVAVAAGAACLVLPYLVWNFVTQGALMPVSGRVKVHLMNQWFSTPQAYWNSVEWRGLFTMFEKWLPALSPSAVVPTVIALLAGTFVACLLPWTGRALPLSLRLSGVIVGLHAATMYAAYRELRPYTEYYFAPEMLVCVLILAHFIARVRWPVAAAAIVVVICAASSSQAHATTVRTNPYWETRVDTIHQLDALAATDDRVGAFWPGAVAALTGRPVTPLDGVIGSMAYLRDTIVPGREMEYASAHGIRWIFVHAEPRDLTASRPPATPMWDSLGLRRLWDWRDRLRVAYSKGGWTIVELLPARDRS